MQTNEVIAYRPLTLDGALRLFRDQKLGFPILGPRDELFCDPGDVYALAELQGRIDGAPTCVLWVIFPVALMQELVWGNQVECIRHEGKPAKLRLSDEALNRLNRNATFLIKPYPRPRDAARAPATLQVPSLPPSAGRGEPPASGADQSGKDKGAHAQVPGPMPSASDSSGWQHRRWDSVD